MVIAVVDPKKWNLKATVRVVRLVYKNGEVIMFADPKSAERYLHKNKVDMLFTEIVMPQINGFMLQEIAEKVQPQIVTVFVSNTDAGEELACRAVKYVKKPLTPEVLIEAMTGTRFAVR